MGNEGRKTKCITQKVPRLCPLVLLVTFVWRLGRELGSEESKMMGNEGRKRKCITQKVPRLYPLVLLVTFIWRLIRELGSEEGKMMGNGLFGYAAEERSCVSGANFVLGGLHYDKTG
jgi:hypothetical protein